MGWGCFWAHLSPMQHCHDIEGAKGQREAGIEIVIIHLVNPQSGTLSPGGRSTGLLNWHGALVSLIFEDVHERGALL